ncbi:MAG TPA: thioredoxin family protein [Rhizomicrobium sp.]|nr:thioredoxin family protein [Rhizomicrobium sp.]
MIECIAGHETGYPAYRREFHGIIAGEREALWIGTIMTMYALPPPTLEVFYSPTCAPCQLELPVLADLVTGAGTQLRIIVLDGGKRARIEIHKASPTLDRDVAPDIRVKPRDALLAAGDTDGILPFARTIAGSGKVCASWRGILTARRVRVMIGTCQRLISQSSH